MTGQSFALAQSIGLARVEVDVDCGLVDVELSVGPAPSDLEAVDYEIAIARAEPRQRARPRRSNDGRWKDWWTGKELDCGQWMTIDVALDNLPAWMRDGGAVATGPAACAVGGWRSRVHPADAHVRRRPSVTGNPVFPAVDVRPHPAEKSSGRRGREFKSPPPD